MADEQKPIFLSHSYHDRGLAEKLVNLLTNGCDVSRNDILCTSLNGMNIKVGKTSFIDYLREQLEKPSLVILLITENYLASSFCLAELGATWRMRIDNFPLAVPPIARNEVGGVLEVTQAGDISNGAYLDQLRDKIIEVLGKKVPTDGWNDQKDIFLNGLGVLIAGIKKPDLVPRSELEKAQGQYKRSLDTINAKDAETEKLNAQVAELKKCKDAAQVKAVTAKYSTSEKQFKQLQQQSRGALEKLCCATRVTLYWKLCKEHYCPEGQEPWDEVATAKGESEVWINEGESVSVELDEEHPRVKAAEQALRELDDFLTAEKQEDFVEELTEERKFPIRLSNKEFWRKYLVHV